MGVGTFPIQDITVGGGTGFNQIVAQLMASLGSNVAARGQVGGGIFSDLLAAQTDISSYITYYNYERRHSGIDYFTPVQFETHMALEK